MIHVISIYIIYRYINVPYTDKKDIHVIYFVKKYSFLLKLSETPAVGWEDFDSRPLTMCWNRLLLTRVFERDLNDLEPKAPSRRLFPQVKVLLS